MLSIHYSHPYTSSPQPAGQKIVSKRSLVGKGKVRVYRTPTAGLQAFLKSAPGKELSAPLPLKGMPEQIIQTADMGLVKRFFACTHLIPERDVEGAYYRVSVHASVNGGVKAKIPFQPGLTLGAVVKSTMLREAEAYQAAAVKLEAFAEQLRTAEQEIARLEIKIAEAQRQHEASGKPLSGLVSIWGLQKESYVTLIKRLSQEISNNSLPSIPIIESLQQGAESPIDFHRSPIITQPRAFESLDFNSEYISMSSSFSEIEDTLGHYATSNRASGKVGWDFLGGRASAGLDRAVLDRVTQIKQSNRAEGVLVINANMTTRHVRCFEQVHYDKQKLQAILSAMEGGDDDAKEFYGITTRGDKKEILLLTEAPLGGSFAGLVTFLKESEEERESRKSATDTGIDASLGGGIITSVVDLKGKLASSTHKGSRAERDFLENRASTNIQVQILALGAVPSFAPQHMKHELLKHLNLNPSQFQLTLEDKNYAKSLSSSSSSAELRDATHERQVQMANAQFAFQAVVRELVAESEEHNVHSLNSVTNAYEHFSKQIATDPNCGVPVGFGYQVLTKADIEREIASLESVSRGSSSSSSSSS